MAGNEHFFQVCEYRNGRKAEWSVIMTDADMTKYLDGFRSLYGYVEGLGGDKNYSIVAWHMHACFVG